MNRAARWISMASVLVLACGQAAAQIKIPKEKDKDKDKNKQVQPASKPAPGQPVPPRNTELTTGPYVIREMPKEWTLRSRIRVTSTPPGMGAQILAMPPGQQRDDNAVNAGSNPGFRFQTLTVVFPIAPPTAGAEPQSDDQIEGWLKVDDKEVVSRPGLKSKGGGGKDLGGGARLAQFSTRTGSGPDEVADGAAREVEMQIEVPMTCYRTKFDDRTAAEVDWPKSDWPPVVKSVFQPQVYVETGNDGKPYDQAKLKETLTRWLGGTDPKANKPVKLAKLIAAEVVRDIQPSGDSKAVLRTGELQGFLLNGIDRTLAEGKGTEFDITCLLTAAYRAAGLPARLVIGVEAEEVDRKFLEKKSGKGQLRSWVEFALYDEVNNTLNWVPVDIAKIRKQSSRPQPVDRPWKFFGTHDELNLITPVSLHFHPPTSVIAYSVPGLWGWMITPTPPATAYQALYFDAYRSSKRANDPKDRNGNNRNNKK